MSNTIIAGKSPFTPTDYRPRTTAGRLLNGEPINMAKTSPNGNAPLITETKPAKPTLPAGTVISPFSTKEKPVALPPKPVSIDFGDGQPPVTLDDTFPRDDKGKPIDADASMSPDEANSHMAEPPRDETPSPAVNTPTTHWTRIPAQMKQFTDFLAGLINDYALFDRDEHGDLKEWTVDSYLEKHAVDLSFYRTFTDARKSLDEMLLGEFKDDLKAIMIEKKCPVEMSTPRALIGHDTIEDGIRAMTGKGVRAAITGKLAALNDARHIEQVNANTQRQIDAAKPQPAPEPPPVKEPEIVEHVAAPKADPKTVEQRSLTVQRNRVPSAPPEHSLTVNWQMNPLQIAQFAVESGLYKGIDSEAKAMMVMLRGLSLQIDPLMALEQINIIEGKTAVSSALMHALVERSGQLEDVTIVETDLQCTVTLTRTGRTPVSVTYSHEDAIRAGLVNKYNWKSMPKLMRYHRAFAIAARRCFSDILLFGGAIYTNEELQPDRSVNEDGDFVTVTQVA